MSAGFMVRIFRTETGSMARSMFFFKEKTLARKASTSCLLTTTRAFTGSSFRTCLNSIEIRPDLVAVSTS